MNRLLSSALLLPLLLLAAAHLAHVLYFAGFRCRSGASLVGKTVVVTGANSGIGKATALDLARRGARVVFACRSRERTRPIVEEIKATTKNPDVVFMRLDLSSAKSVREFATEFLARESRIYVLINNAGMLAAGDVVETNVDGVEMTLAVNHLGHFLLTDLLLDRLKASGPGSRVVTVSSLMYAWANRRAFKDLDDLRAGGLKGIDEEVPNGEFEDHVLNRLPKFLREDSKKFNQQPRVIRYSNSKLANILFTKELAKRVKDSGVTAYAVHPGVIATEILASRDADGHARGENKFKELEIIPLFLNPIASFFKTAEEGAQSTICCAVGEDYAEESGFYYEDGVVKVSRMAEMKDEELAARLWRWSDELVREIEARGT